MSRLLRFGFIAAIAAAVSMGAVSAKPIALEYKLPKKTPAVKPTLPAGLAGSAVQIELTDARGGGDPLVVGSQTEEGKDLYTWESDKPVGPAVAGFAAVVLRGWSVNIDPQASTKLSIHLTRYWVDEKSATFGSNYVAEVALRISLVEEGATAWTREAAGRAQEKNIDARAWACNGVLSLALRDALVQALGSAPVAAPATVVPPPATTPVVPAASGPRAGLPLFDVLVRLKSAGATDDALVGYVQEHKPQRPLTVDEILAWKNAGIPDAAIKAATE